MWQHEYLNILATYAKQGGVSAKTAQRGQFGRAWSRKTSRTREVVSAAVFLLQGKVREAAILKVCVLASGSSGNATFVATEKTRILIDAGLSFRELASRLASDRRGSGETGRHTHQPRAQRSRLRPARARPQAGLPRPRLHDAPDRPDPGLGRRTPPVETFQAGCRFSIGELEVDSFTVPHDAADPVAFAFHAQGMKVASVTDLGYIPESIKYHLRGTQLLILESNHDLEMLKVGPYPWPVKQRVMGRKGHLSNDVVSDFIREDLDSSTATLVLGHISENNNHPELVRLVGGQALAARSLSTKLVIAEPRRQTEVFTL